MPNINEIKQSKFLTKEDCGRGILVTIKQCYQENVALQGAPEDLKWCLEFAEADKPMVLNSTNAQIIAGALGSPETDDWVGKKIVLYHEPNITFGGKLVGGIRARAPRNQPKVPQTAARPAPPVQAQAQPPASPQTTQPGGPRPPLEPEPAEPEDSDVPF